MRIALAILLIPFSSPAADLAGALIDPAGAAIPHAAVELNSGTKEYEARTDDSGVYQFSNLPKGTYALTFRVAGFKTLVAKSIALLEREQKRVPDIALDAKSCRDLILLDPASQFGSLSGEVVPAIADVQVTLICRRFSPCSSTKTDSNGHFTFEMISAGLYGLNFLQTGFYPENATEYDYTVNAGWKSVYGPKSLERCPNTNCDPKLRPKRPIRTCE